MNTIKHFISSDKHAATMVCFAGMYVLSVSTVLGVIEATQTLLALI